MAICRAITHSPSAWSSACELTFLERQEIDYEILVEQHQEYRRLLAKLGAEVRNLECNLPHPDCAFVEDCAVVLDGVTVIANPGAASRRAEIEGIAAALQGWTAIERLPQDVALDGGDVLRVGRLLLVGLSTRTNRAGANALQALAAPLGYETRTVQVGGCLHLKTACTAIDDETLLVNPNWIETGDLPAALRRVRRRRGSGRANLLRLRGQLVAASACPRTNSMLDQLGYQVHEVDLSEFAKAEAGATCLSLLIESANAPHKQPV